MPARCFCALSHAGRWRDSKLVADILRSRMRAATRFFVFLSVWLFFLISISLPPSRYLCYPQVKPGMPYLDVIRRLREASNLPISAYHVSGEYAMMKAAVERGWLDERAAVLEVRPGGAVYRADKGTLLPAVFPCLKKR